MSRLFLLPYLSRNAGSDAKTTARDVSRDASRNTSLPYSETARDNM